MKMPEKLEELLKTFYRKNKPVLKIGQGHPGEDVLACYSEGRLSSEELSKVSEHLAGCVLCAEAFLTQLRVAGGKKYNIPYELRARLKAIAGRTADSVFEIVLKSAGNVFELIYSNGQVLLGQDLIPMQDLRSRNIKDFRDTVSMVKDVESIRIEIKINSCAKGYFNVIVSARNKKTSKLLKDCRVSLIQSESELESYILDKSAVAFERVLLGKYRLEISSQESKIADISVDIKL
ncbi:MAG: hypothetical protein WCY12_00910 [Candidatus Omnitrophota bacterium]